MEEVEEVKLMKYVMWFGAIFLVLSFVSGLLLEMLDMNDSGGIAVAVLIASALFPASKFVRDNRRVPTTEEKQQLIVSSVVVAWVVSLVPFGITMIFVPETGALIERLEPTVLLIAALITTALTVAAVWSAYGPWARRYLGSLRKKEEI